MSEKFLNVDAAASPLDQRPDLAKPGRAKSTASLGSKKYLVEKTRTVLIWRATGVLTGFVLDAAILAWFGMGNQTDAFFAALAIPFLIDSTLSVQFTQV